MGSRRPVLIWAVGLVPLLAAALVVAVVVVRGRGDLAGQAADQTRPGPVLLVAGYGGSTGSLTELAERLRRSGRQVAVVPPVGDNTGDLTDQARALDAAARRQVAAGAPSVDVVGYSAGGVVARIWVAELGGDTLARRVVTLGSPHQGTAVASLASRFAAGACPTACRQLTQDSAVLDGLAPTPDGPRWVSVWTADDDVVVPPDSARLDGAVNVELQQVCPDARVSHGQLPTDPLSAAVVVAALDGAGLAAPPEESACARLRSG